MNTLYLNLQKKIETRTARVSVIGLGYVGLPLMVCFAKAGFCVTGIDVSESKVELINKGQSDINDVSDATVADLRKLGKILATNDYGALAEADIITICVPTPLSKTKDPDLSYIINAVDGVHTHIRPGQLIILESTTYPGTTDELLMPRLQDNGLIVGQDFWLVFSPERIDPGNKEYTLINTPKIVGGVTSLCTRLAQIFYEQIIEQVVTVSSTKTAEMTKLLENTFRSVNIALVNEIALMCDKLDIDVWEIINAAATKPFGFMPFYPGPGLGGHCLPVDPHYLSWKLKALNYNARFIELAGEINAYMPHYIVSKISDALNQIEKSVKGSRILILGVSYKPNIGDIRESPSLDIMRLLEDKGAVISYNDPFVPTLRMNGQILASEKLTPKTLQNQNCVVIATFHQDYDIDMIVKHSPIIFDSRNATDHLCGTEAQKIVKI